MAKSQVVLRIPKKLRNALLVHDNVSKYAEDVFSRVDENIKISKETKTVTQNLTIEDEVIEKIDRIAKNNRLTRSEVMRRILEANLD